jgi:long-subunit fatty acid transport protein
LSVADTGLLISPTIDQTGPTSAFNDSTEYSVGLARRINDSLAVTASYNWENSGDGTTGSLFTINDGYKGITLGARYVIEDLELSVGYNYTELGDVNYSNTTGSLTNELRDNKVQAIGAKVAFRF